MDELEQSKEAAALEAARLIKDGMTLGLGTGSTAFYLIRRVGELVSAGMRLRAVVTSKKTEALAASCHIPVVDPMEARTIDLAIDGVDEIDPDFYAVKGGGGALLREKIIACQAGEVVWVMDESKLVRRLGAFALPVEILPFGVSYGIRRIRDLGWEPVLRMEGPAPYLTDNGNYILDLKHEKEMDYRLWDARLNAVPGVVGTGLFEPVCSRLIIGSKKGVKTVECR